MGSKIVFLGGGSTQFAPALIVDFILARELHGSTIVLVDVDEQKLQTVYQLGQKLIEAGGADLTLERTTRRAEALPGADHVIISVEIDRFRLWEQDRRIPAEHGIPQALGENGGPGGLLHAMRQIPPIVEICWDVDNICPDALVLSLSNPMSRILRAVNEHTRASIIGLCHEIKGGNEFLAYLLDLPEERLAVRAAGLNHFSWYLEIHDAETGEDLYPLVRERAAERPFAERLLAADLLRRTGYLSITSDSHVGEYLENGHVWRSEWAPDVEPIDFFTVYKAHIAELDARLAALVAGDAAPGEFLEEPSGEIVTEVLAAAAFGRRARFNAFNLPNDGYIGNLPSDCIVEVPGWMDGKVYGGEAAGALPEPLAGWCANQAAIHELNAKAAMGGDRQAALEALLLDPVVPDRATAEKCLDAMLAANRDHLPRFFG